jgi:hypothetical protein
MAAWNSSSLAFSDHNNLRNGHGLLKNLKTRISKQHLVEHKMFGSNRGKTGKSLKIGKKFHSGMKQRLTGDMKSSAISPSIEEFDQMMNSITEKGKSSKKKMFSRKQFG